ncbi:DUF2793 domain-containing protein [Pseudorhodobacter sp. W20_MBD10_FR17]|uniref:DUF2793 domain-containing protein n=1 Tax=Pseudorhodobacter sp. W20_MBD10_FR17 TaxID=3240266 RepID=UPI003F9BFAB3
MSITSARLGLPYLMPAQAQKHVTHNEALQYLDALTQLVVEGIGETVPPVLPVTGAVYALGAAPLNAWAGHANQLAYWAETAWLFFDPSEGWQAWDSATNALYVFQGGQWVRPALLLQNLPGVGIGTTSDASNKLSVSADATLLNNAGAGHQLKLNKSGLGDTASLLYQTGFVGHAELGLTGDNSFHVKVSADGSAWTEALVVNAASGLVSGAAVQANAQDTTAGRLARADYVYGKGSLLGTVGLTGGVPTGAVIQRGSTANGEFTRFADGTQICWFTASVGGLTTADGAMFTTSANQTWTFPAAFSTAPQVWGAGQRSSGASGVSMRAAPTTTSVAWRPWATASTSGAYGSMLVAIGRWA